MTATINDLATGLWSTRAGEPVEIVPESDRAYIPGHNSLSTCIRRRDCKPERVPTRWLDVPEPEPEPPRCPNLREIITAHLELGGFDGLAGDGCGCELGDLFPCDTCPDLCAPGYRWSCATCRESDGDEGCEMENVDGGCIRTSRQAMTSVAETVCEATP